MTELRIINVLLWTALLIYMLPGAWATVRGRKVHRGDPMRLGVAAVCIVFILGFGRYLVAPNVDYLWTLVHILALAVGIFVFRLSVAYGRGPQL